MNGLPAEVAVAMSLGPTTAAGGACGSGGESRVRLVGSFIDASDVYDPGKTIKDLWDESHVVKPLEMRALESPRDHDGPGALAEDAMAAEYMRVLASTADNVSMGWGSGF